MKNFMFASIMIIIASLGFTIYIRQDTKKFIRSIRPVPERISVKAKEKPSGPDMIQDIKNVPEVYEQNASEHEVHHHDHLDVSIFEMPTWVNTTDFPDTADKMNPSDSQIDRTHLHTDTETKSKMPQRIIDYDNLTTEEKISGIKKYLVNKHGNIPEVNEYVVLRRKMIEKRHYIPSQNVTVLDMTIEDVARYAELQSLLYPTLVHEENLETIRKFKALQNTGKVRRIEPQTLDWSNVIIR